MYHNVARAILGGLVALDTDNEALIKGCATTGGDANPLVEALHVPVVLRGKVVVVVATLSGKGGGHITGAIEDYP